MKTSRRIKGVLCHVHYLKNEGKYSAFTTYNGVDYYELGATEEEAYTKLSEKLDSLMK